MYNAARLTALLFVFVFFAASSYAQLPDSLQGWETKAYQPITGNILAQIAGNDASLVREYGFASGEHREYGKGSATLAVNLWKMKDSTGSFGLYSFYRDTGTASMESGDRVAIWPDRLLIQHGPYLLDARALNLTKSLSMGEARLLLAKIPPLNGQDSLVPPLPGFLPEQNLIPQSSKFVMGPVAFERLEKIVPASAIGFDQGAEAEMAQYKLGQKNVRMLLVSYATPQMAAKKLRSLQQLPAVSQSNGSIVVDRKGSLVGFVLDASDSSGAEALLHSVRHEGEVTWSEHVPTQRDNIGNLITSVFLLAGFVLLFAVVAGLSFGGLRVLSKKFLPVALFDRPSQVEIIRLNLSDQ